MIDEDAKYVIDKIAELSNKHSQLVGKVTTAISKLDGIKDGLTKAEQLYKKSWVYIIKDSLTTNSKLVVYLIFFTVLCIIFSIAFILYSKNASLEVPGAKLTVPSTILNEKSL